MSRSFRDEFAELFNGQFDRLYRYMDRLSGDPDLAADIAQETFIKLFERGSLPDAPQAWLISVAMNLFRNAHTTSTRRRRLLKVVPEAETFADRSIAPARSPESHELEARVRRALDAIPERERRLLLLRAEGYSYKDIAEALQLQEASVGTLLARAKQFFRDRYEEKSDAS
jgi:RNA polymerase sigma factor (sigma-70 family)